MINKMKALATSIGVQGVGSIEPDRERFWELYNKYKNNLQEVLELVDLMQRITSKDEVDK